jgi:hypothetical protein
MVLANPILCKSEWSKEEEEILSLTSSCKTKKVQYKLHINPVTNL